MATNNPTVGQINTYVPAVTKTKDGPWTLSGRTIVDEEIGRFVRKAAWKIPQTLHGFALHLDGSNWVYQSSFLDKVQKLKEEFDGKHGIKVYVSEKVTWENDRELWRMIHDATDEAVQSIRESLKNSLDSLEETFDGMDLQEADGKIVDRVNDAKRRLKNLSFVIASLALSGNFKEAEKGVEEAIEAGLVAARVKLGKRIKVNV